MKILIASVPAAGHLNPLLSIASLLVESGHGVAVQVNEDLRPAVEAAGHRFLSEIPNAQTSPKYYHENYPERTQKSPGMEMTGYNLVHFFARNIAVQSAGLKMALYDFQADFILADGYSSQSRDPAHSRGVYGHCGVPSGDSPIAEGHLARQRRARHRTGRPSQDRSIPWATAIRL